MQTVSQVQDQASNPETSMQIILEDLEEFYLLNFFGLVNTI